MKRHPRPAEHPRTHHHAVHFYDDDTVICEAVADFFAVGHALGEPLVLLSTPEHRDGIEARLRSRGVELGSDGGVVAFFDAREILDRVIVAGALDEARFHAALEEVFQEFDGSPAGRIRVFGEMVDLLCARGEEEAALHMERLWHALTRDHPLTLLCAYTLGNLYREVNGSLYERICETHTEVGDLPAAS